MTAIDPSRLAAALRRQVSSLAGSARTGGAGRSARTGSSASRAASPAAAEASSGDVAAVVARRVQALDRDDPDRHRKAFRVFLESVLLAEFGPALVNDAGFHRLVDDVQATMQSDRELAAQVREAAVSLLDERGR